jgi:hypothetical protein
LRSLKAEFHTEHILPFSTRTGAGRDELWEQLRTATGEHGANAAAADPVTGPAA